MDWNQKFRLHEVEFDHPAMQVAMPVISVHDGEDRCIGTAFAVAPGLAITAYHVVDDWLTYQERRDGYKREGVSFQVIAFQWFQGKPYPWIVDEIYWSQIADIAFLRFARPTWWGKERDQVQPHCARINFNTPKVGDELRVFGFPNSEIKDSILYVAPSESVVQVRDVDIKTTISMRPLSYLEVDGQIEGGMSGGPCFDSNWNVVGVNSRGWTFNNDDSPISYVALLWPAMNTSIDLYKTGRFPAFDLFSQGKFKALGYKRIYVTSKGEVHLAHIDSDSLIPIPYKLPESHLKSNLEFAAFNAKNALAYIQEMMSDVLDGVVLLNENELDRMVRYFFWELDTALMASLGLAVSHSNIEIEAPILSWEQLVDELTNAGATVELRDGIMVLGFSWNGLNLSQIRAYSTLFRRGVTLLMNMKTPDNKTTGVWLTPCFRGLPPVSLSDGLERYYIAAKNFVRDLLVLCRSQHEVSPNVIKTPTQI